MTERLEARIMWVNSENVRHLPTPFGGMMASDLGRTAFWAPLNVIDLLDLLDLMSTTGYLAKFERGPGRQGISFFLYVRDPESHRIEICCSDEQTMDPDLEPIRWRQCRTVWGAPAPQSLLAASAPFAGVAPRAAERKATSIVAP